MKIWTITSDTDAGTLSELAYSREDADRRATEIVGELWCWHFTGEPPQDWQEGLRRLQEMPGFMDTLSVEIHDVTGHPIIAGLIAEAERFKKTCEYYANLDSKKGDDEGARLKNMSALMLAELTAQARA